ncbi:MAG TPA: class II D-tagatose-bisphosphate aldolase, non-catalytic subunit, partial [Firmicutes bacterium]|nr:class II D-tagatose-bisphosphate aldolase, non-catalytic subunit [Bacillota bacterium]
SVEWPSKNHLKEMVADGVGILKVGPELTFAFREALFLLENIERELFVGSRRELSNLKSVVEEVMLAEPKDWRPYYKGGEEELRFARKYSLSDRIRYYWPHPKISGALSTLLANLNARELPLPLLSQYFPIQYEKIRAGKLVNNPEALIKDHIGEILAKYHFATKP